MKYYLAPMEGVTGRIFRRAYDTCFPSMDKYFTPFLCPNEDGRLSSKEYQEIAPEYNEGLFLVPQILTNHADGFIRTARTLKEMGFEEVNLNLGCPSGTVVSKKRGSGFLAYPQELDQFLYEIFSKTEIKISIKTRLGKEREEEFEKLLDIYNRYPVEELIIHPRVREDYYKNLPRLDAFTKGFSHSFSPVCYNGDIFTVSDYHRLIKRYPALDRVMLGRGIVANPGLLRQIQTGTPVSREQLKEFHDRLYDGYRDFFLATSGQRVILFKMKEFWSYMICMFPDSKKQEKRIKKAGSLSEYETAAAALFRDGCFSDSAEFS